jgi:hypothetical protein
MTSRKRRSQGPSGLGFPQTHSSCVEQVGQPGFTGLRCFQLCGEALHLGTQSRQAVLGADQLHHLEHRAAATHREARIGPATGNWMHDPVDR